MHPAQIANGKYADIIHARITEEKRERMIQVIMLTSGKHVSWTHAVQMTPWETYTLGSRRMVGKRWEARTFNSFRMNGILEIFASDSCHKDPS